MKIAKICTWAAALFIAALLIYSSRGSVSPTESDEWKDLIWHHKALTIYKNKFGSFPDSSGAGVRFVLAPLVEGLVPINHETLSRYLRAGSAAERAYAELGDPQAFLKSYQNWTMEDLKYLPPTEFDEIREGQSNAILLKSLRDSRRGETVLFLDGSIGFR